MTASARRVQLAPPATWDEEALVAAARRIKPSKAPIVPGDEMEGLVVLEVEPGPGVRMDAETEIEIVPTPRRANAPLVEVAIMLDVSGSMGQPWDAKHTRLEAARIAARSLLEAPSPTLAAVTVYEYARETRVISGPAPPGDVMIEALSAPKGRSLTGTSLNLVLADLASGSDPGRSQVILLLTDGVGEVDELRAAAMRARRLCVPVHALVFAPEVDEVLHELAKASGGSAQTAGYPLVIEFFHEPEGST